MMKKRGELLGMPFVMIFALVVGALTLAGGLYYVFKLVPLAETIDINKQVNDFKSVIKAYYYFEEGNTKIVKMQLPGKVTNICVYDSEKEWAPGSGISYPPDFTTTKYKKFFESYKNKNFFVFPIEGFDESTFYVPYLNLASQDNNPICVKNGQNVKIMSMGDHVEIKAA